MFVLWVIISVYTPDISERCFFFGKLVIISGTVVKIKQVYTAADKSMGKIIRSSLVFLLNVFG